MNQSFITDMPTILTEDSTLRLAYADHPKLLLRLSEFVDAHSLQNKPALIIQAAPTDDDIEADVLDPASLKVLRDNGGEENSWWRGFQSFNRPRPTFRGVQATDHGSEPAWACEYHRDGHVIAGLWTFDEQHTAKGAVSCLSDYFAPIFADFARTALGLAAARGGATAAQLTATLLHASDLHFAKIPEYGNVPQMILPTRTQHLCWRVRKVDDSNSWRIAVERMGAELLGIGGARPIAPT